MNLVTGDALFTAIQLNAIRVGDKVQLRIPGATGDTYGMRREHDGAWGIVVDIVRPDAPSRCYVVRSRNGSFGRYYVPKANIQAWRPRR